MDKKILWTKYFHKILYHQTTINPPKTKVVKTVPCYKYELMRPSIGISNFPNIFVADFGHEICLKAISVQKVLTSFIDSYIHATQFIIL